VRRVLAPVRAFDTLLALAVAAFDLYAITRPWDDGHRAGSVGLNAPLVVLVVLPLAWRRTQPALALGLMLTLLGLPALVVDHDYLFWGGFLPLLLVVYTVARRDDGLVGACAWLVGPLLYGLEAIHARDLRSLDQLAFGLAAFLASWVVGRGMHRLDRQEHELSRALGELEAQRSARERSAVAGERTRIAGEMHDVVAHAVSLMVLQVGAARLEVETSAGPEPVSRHLRAAESAGRDALDQLRRSLASLRRAP
jgi:signal transduction histidine kinase